MHCFFQDGFYKRNLLNPQRKSIIVIASRQEGRKETARQTVRERGEERVREEERLREKERERELERES